jgi:hypothetical protein
MAETSLERSRDENQQLRLNLQESQLDQSDKTTELNDAKAQINNLSDQVITMETMIDQKQAILDELSKQLSELLSQQVLLTEEEIPEDWLERLDQEGILVEEWLKFEQIAERYLFLDLRIESESGRIYFDEVYTKINMDRETLLDSTLRQEQEEELSYYIYDWLDHKEGGYSFIFISVVGDNQVTRLATETLFDSLQRLQPSFDKDQYLINRFVKYE